MARGKLFYQFRILVLLFVLFLVAAGTWIGHERALSWNEPLFVAVHVINGDGLQITQDYVDGLDADAFRDIETFMAAEASTFGVPIENPVQIVFSGEVKNIPPPPPQQGNVIQIALWSLKLRWWAWRNENSSAAQIRMFVLYFDPAESPRLAHSLGLRKGRIGVVNAFAVERMARTNNVIVAHEMLHTLGATDKYEAGTGYPAFPIGFAEPERYPLLPQRWAEIMAGRIPLDRSRAETPESLDTVIIGDSTALELRWIE